MAYAQAPQSNRYLFKTVYMGGPDEFETMEDAMADAVLDRPDGEWSKVIVRDGTYIESWGPSDKLIVQAENPLQAIFQKPSAAGFSTLNTWGGDYVLRGLKFVLPSDGSGSGAYAMHHHPGPFARATFDQCHFQSLSATNPGCMGADTDSMGFTYFRQCIFQSLGGALTNMHGGGAFSSAYVYEDCVCLDGTVLNYSGTTGAFDEIGIFGPDSDIPEFRIEGENTQIFYQTTAVDTITEIGGLPEVYPYSPESSQFHMFPQWYPIIDTDPRYA